MAFDKEYPDVIIVPGDDPTYLNREAFNGALIGDVIGGRGTGFLWFLAGGAIGGLIGKERMEKEKEQGRAVHKPESMGATVGKSAAIGALITGVVGAMVAFVAVEFIPLALGFMALGAVVGAVSGFFEHSSAVTDYDNAKSYYDRHGGHFEGRAQEAAKDKEKPYRVSPQEYALLQERLAEPREHAYQASGPALAQR